MKTYEELEKELKILEKKYYDGKLLGILDEEEQVDISEQIGNIQSMLREIEFFN